MDWKEVGLKALWGFAYGAVAELAVVQAVDWRTLWAGVSVAVIRGILVAAREAFAAMKPTGVRAGKVTKSYL